MLPMLAAYGIPAAIGAGQAIAQAIPTKAETENAKAARVLQAKKGSGTLGLSDEERRALGQQMMDPARRLTTQVATAQAAMPQQDLAAAQAARTAQARALGGAASDAALSIEQASMQKAREQEQELEQRRALAASYGQDRMEGITSGVTEIAMGVGKMAGDVPLNIMGPFNTPLPNAKSLEKFLVEKGASSEYINAMLRLANNNPKAVEEALAATYGKAG